MERTFIIENARERARLVKLVNRLTDDELSQVCYTEGWTIAVVLAHLAFWDQRRIVMLRKWKQKGVTPSPSDDDVLNDSLLPFLLAISHRQAPNLAVSTAEALDRELEALSPDLINTIEKLGDRHALNRGIHRKMHLDEIEAFLYKS